MVTHGSGALANLIRSRSSTALQIMHGRRPASLRGRDTPDIEDSSSVSRLRSNSVDMEEEEFRHSQSEERRLSTLLMGPQMRSQRLIGNSNPRYKWGKCASMDSA